MSIVVKDGQIVDGRIDAYAGFGDSGWVLSEPSPAGRNAQVYDVSKLSVLKDGKIRFTVGSNGWDHFDYTVILNPASKSATVSDYGYYDCGSPGAGVGVLDCEQQ